MSLRKEMASSLEQYLEKFDINIRHEGNCGYFGDWRGTARAIVSCSLG